MDRLTFLTVLKRSAFFTKLCHCVSSDGWKGASSSVPLVKLKISSFFGWSADLNPKGRLINIVFPSTVVSSANATAVLGLWFGMQSCVYTGSRAEGSMPGIGGCVESNHFGTMHCERERLRCC